VREDERGIHARVAGGWIGECGRAARTFRVRGRIERQAIGHA